MSEPHGGDAAPRSPDQLAERPSYPLHHVVGIVDTPERAREVAAALAGGGFLQSEIDFSCGQAAGDALDASPGRSGIAGMAIRIAEWLGVSNKEMELKDGYEQALRDGRCVLLVLAQTDERKAIAARTLHDHGGRLITYLGRLSIEVLYR